MSATMQSSPTRQISMYDVRSAYGQVSVSTSVLSSSGHARAGESHGVEPLGDGEARSRGDEQ
jgi:hypothetical protein